MTDAQKYQQASKYKDYCYKIYLIFCTKNKVWFRRAFVSFNEFLFSYSMKKEPYDMTMQKRDFLLILKRLQLIDPLHLTASRIISILAEEDPNIRSSSTDIRLDIEVGELFYSYDNDLFGNFRCVFWNFSRP